jgi:hypothetical protein
MKAGPERRQPSASMPDWPFDGVLYVLAAMQLASVALLVNLVATHGFWRFDTLVGWLLVGVNSGYSAIVVAHELVHRSESHRYNLGRLLLCTVLYDHFAIEHVRGHHSRVGTTDDPATARFGETALAFLRRTIPAQFRSAWRLEKKRLGDENMAWNDRRMLGNRMVHGLLVEWGVAFAILAGLGTGAFAIYLLQAALGVAARAHDGFVGHRLVVHAVHTRGAVASRRPPRARVASLPAASPLRREPEAALRLFRNRRVADVPQRELPRRHGRRIEEAPARAFPRGKRSGAGRLRGGRPGCLSTPLPSRLPRSEPPPA